jgi:hypothetical protein
VEQPFRALDALGRPDQAGDGPPSGGVSSTGVAAAKNPSIRILSISVVEKTPGRTRHSDVAVSFTRQCVSLIESDNGIGKSILSLSEDRHALQHGDDKDGDRRDQAPENRDIGILFQACDVSE